MLIRIKLRVVFHILKATYDSAKRDLLLMFRIARITPHTFDLYKSEVFRESR